MTKFPEGGSSMTQKTQFSAPLVELRNVHRTFIMGEVSVPVLRGVNAAIHSGEITIILGESGSGKTTLLNIIGGIDSPDEGEVIVEGENLAAASGKTLTRYRRSRVGFVFQFYNLIPSLTALENVGASAELVEEPLDPQKALEIVGLGDYGSHFPSQLSGGQQQRVSIARALAKKPRLLLCDEPTGALDRENSVKILELLQNLNREQESTVIMITHSSAIARMGHRLLSLDDGVVRSAQTVENPLSPRELPW